MLTARPEVKRTYSRLRKETLESENDKIQDNDIKDIKDVNAINDDVKNTPEIVKNDKMRKITDFFRVKSSLKEDETGKQSPSQSPSNRTDTNSNHFNTKGTCPSSPTVNVVTNKLKQTFLDLGQKDLISTQCPDCLMHYNKSFPDDVALHKKFHLNYLKGYNFNLKIDEEIVKEIAPDDLIKWKQYRFYEIKRFELGGYKRMEFFLNFVHVQLGAEPLTFTELKDESRGYCSIVAVEHDSMKIVGFGLFEKCEIVCKSKLDCDSSAIELETEKLNSSDFIGVSRIWIDEKYRGKGLASILLDLKCKKRREIVTFSQPTPAGFEFAKKYQRKQFEGGQCLIYLK